MCATSECVCTFLVLDLYIVHAHGLYKMSFHFESFSLIVNMHVHCIGGLSLIQLTAAKERLALPWFVGRVRAAWLRRWQELFGCAAARGFSCSHLDVASYGGDGATQSLSAVHGEVRYA